MKKHSERQIVTTDTQMGHLRKERLALWLIFLAMLGGVCGISLLPETVANEILMENGPVEIISATWYLVVAGLLAQIWMGTGHGSVLVSAFASLLLGLRELDFHSRFTTMGIFKTKFYISPTVPLQEKIIVTAIVLTLLFCFIIYVKKNRESFLTALKTGKPWAWGIAAALLGMVVSKTIDRNTDIFHHLLSWLHPAPVILVRALEEVMEMAIPAFLLVSVFSYLNDSTRTKSGKRRAEDKPLSL